MSDFEGQAMAEGHERYTVTLEYDHDADNPLDWAAPKERHTWYALRHRRYGRGRALRAQELHA